MARAPVAFAVLVSAAGCAHVIEPSNEVRIDECMRPEVFDEHTPGAGGIALLEPVAAAPEEPESWKRSLFVGRGFGLGGGIPLSASTVRTTSVTMPTAGIHQTGGTRINLGSSLATGGRHF